MIYVKDSETPLTRSLSLLAWCAPAGQFSRAENARTRSVWRCIMEAQSALHLAISAQMRAVSALSEEMPKVLLNALQAREPQDVLNAQLEISATTRTCASECARACAGASQFTLSADSEGDAPIDCAQTRATRNHGALPPARATQTEACHV